MHWTLLIGEYSRSNKYCGLEWEVWFETAEDDNKCRPCPQFHPLDTLNTILIVTLSSTWNQEFIVSIFDCGTPGPYCFYLPQNLIFHWGITFIRWGLCKCWAENKRRWQWNASFTKNMDQDLICATSSATMRTVDPILCLSMWMSDL